MKHTACLSDPDKKSKYDRFGHAGVDPNAGFRTAVPADLADSAQVALKISSICSEACSAADSEVSAGQQQTANRPEKRQRPAEGHNHHL